MRISNLFRGIILLLIKQMSQLPIHILSPRVKSKLLNAQFNRHTLATYLPPPSFLHRNIIHALFTHFLPFDLIDNRLDDSRLVLPITHVATTGIVRIEIF